MIQDLFKNNPVVLVVVGGGEWGSRECTDMVETRLARS